MAAKNIRIAMAQQDFTVGAIEANTQKIIESIVKSAKQNVELLVFPELTICGYPPEDLLFRQALFQQIETALQAILEATGELYVVLGVPVFENNQVFNQALIIHNGAIIARYNKRELPNYSVFDEKRYFTAGSESCVFEMAGLKVGVTICEDIWFQAPIASAVEEGAELIVNLNASPFHVGKVLEREAITAQRVHENKVPIVYVNLVGGQDELVFDGASFIMSTEAQVVARLGSFSEELAIVDFDTQSMLPLNPPLAKHLSINESIYRALVLGVRDYVYKNGFKSVILGLSGGIDSALTLVVAVDALGAENVEAVMLPTRYTADISLEDAETLAKNLS
ncbi:MAG: nitrilase-related carbon-nitrogen hydrolase, partial [Gammaproteobacteria bacterium]|nr:nitrilase-related carbon-nitrogen hydrolase [Gammaproteobacteria bacterium]